MYCKHLYIVQLWSIDITNCPPQLLGCDAWVGCFDHLRRDPLLARRDGGPPGQSSSIFQPSRFQCEVFESWSKSLSRLSKPLWYWKKVKGTTEGGPPLQSLNLDPFHHLGLGLAMGNIY